MKPSPRNLLMMPWFSFTSVIMVAKSVFRYATTSVGVFRSANAVKPRMSRNMMVTRRTSPAASTGCVSSWSTTAGDTYWPNMPTTRFRSVMVSSDAISRRRICAPTKPHTMPTTTRIVAFAKIGPGAVTYLAGPVAAPR
jgi:hypothetical protein